MSPLLLTLAYAADPHAADPRAADPHAAEPRTLAFGTDLLLPGDRMLRGNAASESVVLPRPAAWALSADPVVHVRFSHSATLAASSTVTLLLDDRAVASTRLDMDNAADGELVATLPRSALHDYNRLTVSVEQRAAAGCESPFDPGLWTRLSATSTVDLPGGPVALPLQLLDFPAPLWDPLGTGPLRLTPVQSGPVGGATLEAAGELAFALGRLADYRGVRIAPAVARVEDATTPAVLFGTPDENGAIRALVDTAVLRPDEGLLALVANPAHPELPVLVVTGGSAAGVRNAARALTRPDRARFVAGARAVIAGSVESTPPASLRSPRPLTTPSATLAELGLGDHTTVGLYGAPLVVPVSLAGDSRVRPGGGTLTVHYAYGAGLDPRVSTLEVRIDGVGVRSIALSNPAGEAQASLRVNLPASLVTPGSVVQVGFDLFPAGFETCGPPVDRQLWGTVFADSTLSLPHDSVAAMPDLGLLRYRLWPFSAEGPEERVDVVVADRAAGEEIAAGMQVVAALAAHSLADGAPVRLVSAPTADRTGMTIVLASRDRPNALFTGDAAGAPGLFTEAWPGPGQTRLTLAAADAAGLLPLATTLADDDRSRRLSGSAAVQSADGLIHPVSPAGTTWARRGTAFEQARARLQEHGSLLALFGMPGALGAALLARRWTRRRGGVA